VRSGDIVHYRVEKIRNRGRVWRYRGRRAFISLPPKVPLRLRGGQQWHSPKKQRHIARNEKYVRLTSNGDGGGGGGSGRGGGPGGGPGGFGMLSIHAIRASC